MVKLVNYLCLVEAGLGILLTLVLPHNTGYVFGGGLILGAVFTFFIGLGLGMMAHYNDYQSGKDTAQPISNSVENLNKGI